MNFHELRQRFHSEVMNANIEAALPANLSDELLDFLSIQIDAMNDPDDGTSTAELFSAVLKILFFKSGYKKLEITHSQLLNYVELYANELSVEKVNRTTNSLLPPATVETILTKRSLEVIAADRK